MHVFELCEMPCATMEIWPHDDDLFVCLQGFWDMVNCQVSDLLTKFSDLKKLEERDWKTAPPSPMQFEMKVKCVL